MLGQRQYDTTNDGVYVALARLFLFLDKLKMDNFRGQPPSFLRVYLLVGAEQLERCAGLIILLIHLHPNFAPIVQDKLGNQRGWSNVEAAIRRNGHLDSANLSVALEHSLAQLFRAVNVQTDVGNRVVHQDRQQLLGLYQRL